MIEDILKTKGFQTDLSINLKPLFKNEGVVYSAHGNIIRVVEDFDEDKNDFVKQLASKDKKLDGVIFISNVNTEYCTCDWEYYNRDGNEVDFCGNGLRCIMKYIFDKYKVDSLSVSYKDENIVMNDSLFDIRYNEGNIMVQSPDHIDDDEFTHVTQSLLEAECEKLDIEVIDMELHRVGVPHLIVELKENVLANRDLLEILGSILSEYYTSNIDAEGVNINFVNLNSDLEEHSINIITWERGVNRITESCGSGSLASYYYYLNDNTIPDHKDNVRINLLKNRSFMILEDAYITYLSGKVVEYDPALIDKINIDYEQSSFI